MGFERITRCFGGMVLVEIVENEIIRAVKCVGTYIGLPIPSLSDQVF